MKLTYSDTTNTVSSDSGTFDIAPGTQVDFEIIPGNDGWDDVGARYIDITVGDGRTETVGSLDSFELTVTEDTRVKITFGEPRSANVIEIVNNGGGTIETFLGESIGDGCRFKVVSTTNYGYISLTYETDAEGTVPFIRFFNHDSTIDHSTDAITLDLDSQTITYWCTGGQYRIEVDFVQPPRSMSLSEDELTMTVGETHRLKAAVQPEGSGFDLSWYAPYRNGIAEVDQNGLVTAVGPGTVDVDVEAYIPYTNICLSDSCRVTVLQPHTITVMDTDGGTAVAEKTTAVRGENIGITVTPSDNHHVSGIVIGDDSGMTIAYDVTDTGFTFVMPDSDVTVEVSFSIDTHTVRFLVWNELHHEGTYEHGATIVPPEDDPERESTVETDYSFIGWDGYTEGMVADRDYEFQAMWSEAVREYDIVFIAGDSVIAEETLPYGSEIEPPVAPRMDGFEFVGWDGYTEGMTVDGDRTFVAVYAEAEPEIPIHDHEDEYVPIPPIVYTEDDDDDDDLWIFVVLGSVAICMFLVFFRFERRE